MRLGATEWLALALFVSGIGLAIFVGSEGWQGAVGVCLLSIAFALALVKGRLRRETLEGVPDFLTVFLAFQLVNKILTIVSLAAGDSYLTPYEAAELVDPIFAFRAEWVHFGAMALFTAGWVLVEKSLRGKAAPQREVHSVRFLVAFYVLVVVAALALQRVGTLLSVGLLSTFMQYSALATVGVLLASKSEYGLGGSKILLTALMLAPPLFVALISGTKGAIVMVALPLLMAGLAKGWRRVMVVLVPLALFLVVVGAPLSHEMRTANWESYGAREDIGIVEGISRVWDRYLEDGAQQVIERTAIKFAHRASSAQTGGVVMRIAEQDGLIGMEPIRLLPAIFVPRILWHDKPTFQPGAWFSWYLGYATSPESATTATATMLGTEFYWMFGGLGLGLVLLLGMLYAGAWRALTTLSRRGLMGVAGMYALLGTAIRFEETHVVYAIASPIIAVVYSYVLVLLERTIRTVNATTAKRL